MKQAAEIFRVATPGRHEILLQVAEGEVLGIAGPNGAGKSTLLSLLLGYLRPTSGRVLIRGLEPRSFVEKNGIGYLSELMTINPNWKAEEALTRFATLAAIPASEVSGLVNAVIDALARDLNMSQVPIREAIRRLQAEGWITYRHNSGPEVANIGLEQWQATMEVLAILEGYATALAAESVSAEDIARLRDLAQAMQHAMEQFDLLGFSASNRQFHRVIYARCPNPVLVERITETQAQLDAMRGTLFPSVPQRGADSIAEHRELIELLRSGIATR